MYAYATITAQRPGLLTLPASAVLTQGDVNQGFQSFCFLVADGKIWRTPIEIGARDQEWVEVLKKKPIPSKPGETPNWEDFAGKEEVVRGDLAGLTDGQPFSLPP
jgi:hypothetical protein